MNGTTAIGKSNTYWQQGRDCLDKGMIDEALELCRLAVETAPESADAHFNLGRVFCRMEREEEEMQEYLKATALDPRHADALNNIGAIHYRHKRLEEALADFSAAAALAPEDGFILKNVGMVLCLMDRCEEAITWLRAAVRAAPENFCANLYLARAACEVVRKKWEESESGDLDAETKSLAEEALAAAWGALAIDPKDKDTYLLGAELGTIIKSPDVEVEFLEKAIRVLPRFPVPYLFLAACYIDYCGSDPDALLDAERLLDEAQCLDPASPMIEKLRASLVEAHTQGIMQSGGGWSHPGHEKPLKG